MRPPRRSLLSRVTGREPKIPIETEVGFVEQDVLEHRIGVVGAAPPALGPGSTATPVPTRPARIVVAGSTAATSAVSGTTSLASAARRSRRGPTDRRRLWRDTAAALVGVAAILLFVIYVVPRERGEVLAETGTPAPSETVIASIAAPSPSGVVVTDPPAAATEDPNATPEEVVPIEVLVPPTASPKPTPRPTARPTPRPNVAPVVTPKPTPKATKKPTPKPKPTPTPVPLGVAFLSCEVSVFTVRCDGSGSQDVSTWSWDFGDGTTDTGKVPGPHTFDQAGGYTITLTVTPTGPDSTATQYVTVPKL